MGKKNIFQKPKGYEDAFSDEYFSEKGFKLIKYIGKEKFEKMREDISKSQKGSFYFFHNGPYNPFSERQDGDWYYKRRN